MIQDSGYTLGGTSALRKRTTKARATVIREEEVGEHQHKKTVTEAGQKGMEHEKRDPHSF